MNTPATDLANDWRARRAAPAAFSLRRERQKAFQLLRRQLRELPQDKLDVRFVDRVLQEIERRELLVPNTIMETPDSFDRKKIL